MNLMFTDQTITAFLDENNPNPTGKFPEQFKNLILGLAAMVNKDSEAVKIDVKENKIEKEFPGKLSELESITRVLIAFEKFCSTNEHISYIKQTGFTNADVSLIFSAINKFLENVKKPSIKLLKDMDEAGHKQRNAEVKDMSKLNSDWYMYAIAILKQEG